jgi:hypothetical protein
LPAGSAGASIGGANLRHFSDSQAESLLNGDEGALNSDERRRACTRR